MTAADTALRVLIWAMADAVGRPLAPAPTGDLTAAGELADPDPAQRTAISDLTTITAARLRLTRPAFGDPRPLPPDVLLMAAAVGAREHPVAAEILGAVAPAIVADDLLVRHGLVRAVLAGVDPAARPRPPQPRPAERRADPAVPEGLIVALTDASPLTGVLGQPANPHRCEQLIDDVLLDDARGRNLLTLAWSVPPVEDAASQWRGTVLASLTRTHPDLVLDVYETAMASHRRGHLARVAAARTHLASGYLRAAAATARWWQALAQMERSRPQRLSTRAALTGYRPGTDLYWLIWGLGGLR